MNHRFNRGNIPQLSRSGTTKIDHSAWIGGTASERISLLPAAQEHVLSQEDGKDRCIQAVRELTQAFVLAVPHEDAIRDNVNYFSHI